MESNAYLVSVSFERRMFQVILGKGDKYLGAVTHHGGDKKNPV